VAFSPLDLITKLNFFFESSKIAGELKVLLSLVTGLWPREQRLIFKGKEREDYDHLHMVGVQNMDKVLLLEDPVIKERKLRSSTLAQLMGVPSNSFIRSKLTC
jgi:Ubiquitin family